MTVLLASVFPVSQLTYQGRHSLCLNIILREIKEGILMNKENILIVDDSRDSRNILSATLNTLQYFNLFRAEDGESALKQYETRDIDICFLDIEMPAPDGLETLKRIKELYSDAYVIMLTGNSDVSVVSAAIKGGASGYIVKPFAAARIQEVLNQYESKPTTPAS